MRPSNVSLTNALAALQREQEADEAKLEALRDSLVDARAALKEGRAADIQAINDFGKELIAAIERRYDAIDQDFGQKIAALEAHMADIRSARKEPADPPVIAKLAQVAAE